MEHQALGKMTSIEEKTFSSEPTSLKNELQIKILEYLRRHPDLISFHPGINNFLAPLAAEALYTRVFAWILSPQKTDIIGPCLLAKALFHTYQGYDNKLIIDLLGSNYNVFTDYQAHCGQIDILIEPESSKKFTVLIQNQKFTNELKSGLTEENQLLNQLQNYENWAKSQGYEHIFLLSLGQHSDQMVTSTAFKTLSWRTVLEDLKHLLSHLIIPERFTSFLLEIFIQDLEKFISSAK